ncbi:LysR family transcriptional regulator [Novosphingobium resinovorum]
MDPRALLTFRAVCDTGSISAAARALNLSQPSVSNTISLLERKLGVVLFERGRGGIVLTAEGEVLQRRAEAMATLLGDAVTEIEHTRQGIAGPLRIGGTPGALLTLLPGAIMRVEEAIGDFALSAIERPDEELLEMVRKGAIELAFVTTGIESVPADMKEVTCASDPFVLIVGPRHEKLPGRVSLREVESYPGCCPRRAARSGGRSTRCSSPRGWRCRARRSAATPSHHAGHRKGERPGDGTAANRGARRRHR